MSERRFHIIVDAVDCDRKAITDKNLLNKALRDIAKLCEMSVLYGPVVIEGLPVNPGLTGFVIVDFSHISIHTFSKTNEVCVDVFSCKKYDYNQVKNYIQNIFGLKENKLKYIEVH